MRRPGTILVPLLLLAGCRDRHPATAAPLDPNAVIASLIRGTSSDADLATLASKRAKSPGTRAAAAEIGRRSVIVSGEWSALGQRHKLPLPPSQEEKRIALKENLLILRPDLFDRAYALAMVQEMSDLLRTVDAAGKSSDPEVQQLAIRHRPMIVEEQAIAKKLLDQTGGVPWPGFAP
jgi:predicted outer membrane protein